MLIDYSQSDIYRLVAKRIMPLLQRCSIFTLDGPLGAGKTTLVKEILKQAGIIEPVTSPTFGYVNTYHTKTTTIHHFDLYRVSSLETFVDAGLEELIEQNDAISFIEWPGVIDQLLEKFEHQGSVCHIKIAYHPSNATKRTISIE